MKILFFQQKRELYYSVHILFDIIRKHLPKDVEQKVVFFSHLGLSSLKKIQHLAQASTREEGDINHIVEEINYAAFFMKKEKTILTIHDIMRLYKTSGLKRQAFIWFWLRLPIARSGTITAVSHTTRNEILKYVKCSPEKIRVIYNCISPEFVPVPKSFNKQKPVLLQVGIKPGKNLPRLIEAIKGIECKLNIIGKPSADAMKLLEQNQIDFSWKD